MQSSTTVLPSPRHADFYNALPDVMDADAHVTRLGRHAAIDHLIEVIVRHGMGDLVGIRLLHNHCPISPVELMVEEEEMGDGGPVLATAPRLTDSPLTDGLAPNSWALVDGAWTPVEFSAEDAVRRAAALAMGQTSFLADFATRLQEMGAAQTLGLCVFERQFFRFANPSRRDEILVETTDTERRANILRFDDATHHAPGSLIETVWVAGVGSDPTANCPTRCGTRCQILMSCQDYSTGHQKFKVSHDKQHTGPEHWSG
ncbi:hypothetical protein Sa4125_06310 [Aureimonas sp. SA4125]|uniref:hypothetical protein n=1 Tax=Aureimonas sp. SA4125 TaxID=2826993 RepID=UPI001CC7961B|nr:hypothetical protein [Aureimonas sp. SA4125]BDA83089.1 hypothetical protein Sa4125_06310 [Aureimonas sp. SA4125]